jgi:predicted GIY-YIG superfamily endonuclease
MLETELIVYVTKDEGQKYKCALIEVDMLGRTLLNGKAKLVYFEKFNSNRTAKSRLRKIQSLNRIKLIELIKDSNPAMLNLINCI